MANYERHGAAAEKLLLSGDKVVGRVTDLESGWVETASADNATATASRAAETGASHYITSVAASYSASATGLLQVKDGTTVIFEAYVYDDANFTFPRPIQITEGNAVSVELEASGTSGLLGKANLSGVTF